MPPADNETSTIGRWRDDGVVFYVPADTVAGTRQVCHLTSTNDGPSLCATCALIVVGGGSNVVAADTPFAGGVLHIAKRRVRFSDSRVEIAVGESWDAFVASQLRDRSAPDTF